jgi:hypothetical protein
MRRILAWAALAVWAGVGGSAAAEPVGFIAVANGDVSLREGGAWHAAARDGEVEIGDAIRTGTGASAKVVLVDDSLLQIDEESEIQIETWHVGDAATKETSIVRQARGRLRTTVGDAFGGSTRLEVHIPTAAIGIKGTDFETVQGTIWEVCLLSGAIVVSNQFGQASPGEKQCVYAYGDKAPGDAHPNPRTPLDVPDGAPGGDPVADSDFEEKVSVQVGAEPPGPGDPVPPPDNPWDGLSDQNREDELEPEYELPDPPEPPVFEIEQ